MDNLLTPEKIMMREKFKKYPLFFCKTVAPKKFNLPWASYHQIMADEIIEPTGNVRITLLLANRGGGKSTFFLGGMSLNKILCHGYQNVIFGSNVEDTAKEFLAHPKSIIQGDNCKYYYGDLLQKPPNSERREVSKKRIVLYSKELGIHARISVKGADSQWEGINFDIGEKSIRWQLLMLDDVETEKSAYSSDQVDRMISWITTSVMFGRDTNSRIGSHIYIVGTTFYPNAALERLQRFKKVVKTFIFPALVMGRNKVWLISNLKGPDGNQLKEGDSTWEQNPAFKKGVLLKERADYISMNKLGEWMSQRQLEPSEMGGDRFDISKLKKYTVSEGRIPETGIKIDELLFVMFIDAAYTEKKHSDDLAIMLWAIDWRENFYLWDEFAGKVSVEAFFVALEAMLTRNPLNKKNFLLVGLESSSFPFFSVFVRASLRRVKLDEDVVVTELKPGNIPKGSRIRKLIPINDQGRLWDREEHLGFEDEMLAFDAGAKKIKKFNRLDASAYLTDEDLIITPEPPVDMEMMEDEAKELAFRDFFGDLLESPDPNEFHGIYEVGYDDTF